MSGRASGKCRRQSLRRVLHPSRSGGYPWRYERRSAAVKLLFLRRGTFSGTNDSLLRAWRSAEPGLSIEDCDPLSTILARPACKMTAAARALGQGRMGVLRGGGRLSDFAKNDPWFIRQVGKLVQQHMDPGRYDSALVTAFLLPIPESRVPYFIYTDSTILSNLYFPEGRACLHLYKEWLECEFKTIRGARLF